MKFKSSRSVNQRIERITIHHLVVGIDIAKELHVAGAVNYRGRELGHSLKFRNDADGFERLLRWVEQLKQRYNLMEVIYGIESTGHYGTALAQWLHTRGLEVVQVNPLTTKRNKENRDNRPSKNDEKDAIVIADTVSRGYYSTINQLESPFRKLQCLVNEHEVLKGDLAALGNRLQMLVDQVFPELFTKVFKQWDTPRAIATLRAFPLPADIRSFSIEAILDGWRSAGMARAGGTRGNEAAAKLLAAARASVGVTDIGPELKAHIHRVLDQIEALHEHVAAVEREIDRQLEAVPNEVKHPMQAVGLSPLLTAVILANAGDLRGYQHGAQLMAHAGLNLCERRSGKHQGQVVLSKRGRRQLRKYLFLAMLNLVSHSGPFRSWHEHNVKVRKMKGMRSILKLIGKLSRILVALARKAEPFQPTVVQEAA